MKTLTELEKEIENDFMEYAMTTTEVMSEIEDYELREDGTIIITVSELLEMELEGDLIDEYCEAVRKMWDEDEEEDENDVEE